MKRARSGIEANGFTLVELLISLAVLGMTTAMLMAGLSSVRIIAERSQQQVATGESIATAQTILRNRIENMVPSTRFDTEQPIADVRGANSIISFLAPSAPAERPNSLSRYRLLRTAPGDLVLYSVSDLSSQINIYAPGQAGWTPTILLSNTQRLELSYYGAGPSDNRKRWRNEWIERNQPPELVRVRVRFKSGDKRQWPDLIIRPTTTVNSACELDPFTGECR